MESSDCRQRTDEREGVTWRQPGRRGWEGPLLSLLPVVSGKVVSDRVGRRSAGKSDPVPETGLKDLHHFIVMSRQLRKGIGRTLEVSFQRRCWDVPIVSRNDLKPLLPPRRLFVKKVITDPPVVNSKISKYNTGIEQTWGMPQSLGKSLTRPSWRRTLLVSLFTFIVFTGSRGLFPSWPKRHHRASKFTGSILTGIGTGRRGSRRCLRDSSGSNYDTTSIVFSVDHQYTDVTQLFPLHST